MTDLTKLSAYRYDLPEALIAQKPVEPRDQSRLMLIDRKTGSITHHVFRDIETLLKPTDVLVVNNTQVMKARLLGHRLQEDGSTGGEIEFLLLERQSPKTWVGIMRSSAKQVVGFRFKIPSPQGDLVGRLISGSKDSPDGTVVAELNHEPYDLDVGELPLPPYIERKPGAKDDSTYQTVYAKELGSAAAPTAGLHFTPELLTRLSEKGIIREEVTLHVGMGTFRPVKTQDIREHVMHQELFEIGEKTWKALEAARAQHRRIVAVGTTSVRTLESAKGPGRARTGIFITPGYEFKKVDALITNFHLPESTLLMLVSAFGGYELMKEAYRVAVQERYRFFSYGDAMLIV